MTRAPFALALSLLIAACGSDTQYLVAPVGAEQQVALRVRSVELRDVVLPEYAEAPEILQQGADGGLRPIRGAVWGDGSARAVTGRLAASLAARTTARVAAEPWPLEGYPEAAVSVRIDRIVARADAQFEISGQFAIAAPERPGLETLQRFAVVVPVVGAGPGAIAQAKGAALDAIAAQIAGRLAR